MLGLTEIHAAIKVASRLGAETQIRVQRGKLRARENQREVLPNRSQRGSSGKASWRR